MGQKAYGRFPTISIETDMLVAVVISKYVFKFFGMLSFREEASHCHHFECGPLMTDLEQAECGQGDTLGAEALMEGRDCHLAFSHH